MQIHSMLSFHLRIWVFAIENCPFVEPILRFVVILGNTICEFRHYFFCPNMIYTKVRLYSCLVALCLVLIWNGVVRMKQIVPPTNRNCRPRQWCLTRCTLISNTILDSTSLRLTTSMNWEPILVFYGLNVALSFLSSLLPLLSPGFMLYY